MNGRPVLDPPAASRVSVLVVDDHRLFAEVLAMQLRADPMIDDVDVATSTGVAQALLNSHEPDLLVLDYSLGDRCGLELMADVEGMAHPPRTLILSAGSDPERVVRALEAGCQGWIIKDASVTVLLGAMSEVVHGGMYLSPSLLPAVIRRLLRMSHAEPAEATFLDVLSHREREVLACLMVGMSRDEVAANLYISPNTVRTHVRNLLRRAGVHSTVALVAAARQAGFAGTDQDDLTMGVLDG